VLTVAGNFAGTGGESALEVFTVAKSTDAITAQGVVKVMPTYSIANAPKPDYVVIPGGMSSNLSNDPAMLAWLTSSAKASDATLTVCTGAFPLAEQGFFDGLEITTFYNAIPALQAAAPKAKVTPGRRFIDNGHYITTAGVSAGIDGALHLTARLFGRRVADQTARYMEYAWTPEPYLAKDYAYYNPSTDDRGRAFQAAEQAVEEQRWADATTAFKALAPGDKSGQAWLGLGNTHYHQKAYQEAVAAYAKVTTKQKQYPTAIYNLACSAALGGDKARAVKAIKLALKAGITKEQALADSDLASIKAQIETL
jgi:putative intracellular protease/amidase